MPDPAAPPTPPVPLAALLAREDLGLRQIAGPRDAGTVILWAHTSEMADPYPYLLGGELLLTAGVHATQAAGAVAHFDAYVARVVEAGGAALGFGLAPVHDSVPRALVEACDKYGLPLLEVPPRTTFSAVARAVWALMAQVRLAELRRVTEAQQGLARAAARPDPVPAVLRQLANRLGGWTVLAAPDGTRVLAAGAEPDAQVRQELADLGRVVRPSPAGRTGPGGRAGAAAGGGRAGGATTAGTRAPGEAPASPTPPASPSSTGPRPTSATNTVGTTHLAVYLLGGGKGFTLGVASDHREPGDHTITGVAVVLLSLLTGEHQGAAEAARSAALVRLLLGAPPADVAGLLGVGRWQVVQAHRGEPVDPLAATALGAALGSPLVDVGEGVVRVLVAADREPLPQPGWTLGVSEPAAVPDLATADAQAGRALAHAEATRAPLVRHRTADHGLAALVPAADAEAHARVLLAPIAGTPALTETLRTWLSLHGSWDRTAVALGVHRNTVRQRIARCGTLLDADLDDPDVRMELWFALRNA
ncbi:PucR family transcriptional regulator ligand-binding domain-containing protein [Streptomyces sp. NPDC002004]